MGTHNNQVFDWSTVLWSFASSLPSPVEYVERGNQLCEQLTNQLRIRLSANGTPVDFLTTGSMECGVDTLIPEYNILVGLKRNSNRENVVNMIANQVLSKQRQLQITPGSIELETKSSLKFLFLNGIKVGLTVAGDELFQYHEDYQQFLVEQSQFTKQLLRLVRLWYNMKSSFFDLDEEQWKVVELISVAGAIAEEENGGGDFLMAFRNVFERIMAVDKNCIRFERTQKEAWGCTVSHLKLKLKKEVGAKWTLLKAIHPTCILDPVSDANVLSESKVDLKIPNLQRFGKGGLSCLGGLERNVHTVKYKRRYVIEFNKFFEPLAPYFPGTRLGFPSSYRLRSEDNTCCGKLCHLGIIDEELVEDNDNVRNFVHKMKDGLVTVVGCIMRQGLKEEELHENLERSVRKFLRNYLVQAQEDESHDDWHVWFSVPFGGESCVKIWFSFS